MSYQLTISQQPTYLYAVVTGQNSTDNVRRYLEEIHNECVTRSCFRVLVEERLEWPRLAAMDVFRIAMQGSTKASGQFQAFAYVDVNAEGDLMQFAKTVAVNRDMPVVIFPTVADAHKWLVSGDNKDTQPEASMDLGGSRR